LSTLPVYCNHFTLGNPKKSFLNSIIHTDFRLLRYLRRNKLQLLYCSLSVYLLLFTASYYLHSPCYGQFLICLVSHFSIPPMPTHNQLFSESPTFGGTQHYLQSDVKFYILQGSVVTFFRCGG